MAAVEGQGEKENLQKPGQKLPENSTWMSNLDPTVTDCSLNRIAIPGSHDSFANHLDTKGPVAPGNSIIVRALGVIFGGTAKRIIKKWSTTQSLTVAQQLQAGIRYFDIRVSTRPRSSKLYAVHGLFANTISDNLTEINSFLNKNQHEIVLLDFNHFYAMKKRDHAKLLEMILSIFDSKICSFEDISAVTLQSLWDRQKQVLVFYHNDSPSAKECDFIWPGSAIPSPWPSTTSRSSLIKFLNYHFSHERPSDSFDVTQGVLTPDVPFVIAHLFKTLKGELADPAAPVFVNWLRGMSPGNPGINVCIMDFVEIDEYIDTVINLNSNLKK